MSAPLHQMLLMPLHQAEQIHARNAAGRSPPDSGLFRVSGRRQDKGRLIKLFRQFRGHNADHAFMKVPLHDGEFPERLRLRTCFQLQQSGLNRLFLFPAPFIVELFQLPGNGRASLRIRRQKPFDDRFGAVGAVHSAGGINPGADHEPQGIGVHIAPAAGVAHHLKRGPPALPDDFQSRPDKIPVGRLIERHNIADRPQGNQIQGFLQQPFRTALAVTLPESPHQLPCHSTPGNRRQVRFMRQPGMDDCGRRLGILSLQAVMIGNDHIDPVRFQLLDFRAAGNSAVNGNHKLRPHRCQTADIAEIESISFRKPVRQHDSRGKSVMAGQALQHPLNQGGSAGTIHIIVAQHNDMLFCFKCPPQAGNRLVHLYAEISRTDKIVEAGAKKQFQHRRIHQAPGL